MKKALIVLLLLAVAGGLFAQGFTFNGYVNSGLSVFIPDGDADDTTVYIKAVGRDSEQQVYRARFIGAYANEAGTAGYNFRLQAQGYDRVPYFDFAYGWLKAFDNMVELYGGRVDNGYFGSGGGILDADMGEGNGLLAVVNPIDILTLGVGAYTNGGTPAFKDMALDQAKYTFGARMILPDLVHVTLAFRNPNGTAGYDSSREPTTSTWMSPSDNSARGILGVRLLAIPNLTAILEAEFNNINDIEDNGVFNIFQTVGYKVGALEARLSLGEYFVLADLPDGYEADPVIRAWAWVTYGLMDNKVVPRFDVSYILGGWWNSDNYAIYYKNHSLVYNHDASTVSFRPSVQFKVDANSYFELGWQTSVNMIDAEGADNELSHIFMTDFKVSF